LTAVNIAVWVTTDARGQIITARLLDLPALVPAAWFRRNVLNPANVTGKYSRFIYAIREAALRPQATC
jgi:hypothetical protein